MGAEGLGSRGWGWREVRTDPERFYRVVPRWDKVADVIVEAKMRGIVTSVAVRGEFDIDQRALQILSIWNSQT